MLPEAQTSVLIIIAYTLLASFGGTMGYILRTIDSRQKIIWWYVVIQGCAAGFVGLLFLLACMAMDLSAYWTGVIVGFMGWLGAGASVKVLEKLVFNKLGITMQASPVQERKDDVPDTPSE